MKKLLISLLIIVSVSGCAGWDFRVGNYSTTRRNFTMPVRGAYGFPARPAEESTTCPVEFRPWNETCAR